jgi:hypothetical protein
MPGIAVIVSTAPPGYIDVKDERFARKISVD